MFTGIISHIGRVQEVTPRAAGFCLRLNAGGMSLADVAIGDSIAHNGVCLTVVSKNDAAGEYTVDVSPETLACTSGLTLGAAVNLERAMRLSDRLDGHLVTGHVDGVGCVAECTELGDNLQVVFAAPAALSPFIAKKGSITVNGVSLTVNSVEQNQFSVHLIAHTLSETNLKELSVGATVNLEVDIIARYVARLAAMQATPPSETSAQQ